MGQFSAGKVGQFSAGIFKIRIMAIKEMSRYLFNTSGACIILGEDLTNSLEKPKNNYMDIDSIINLP